jgi:protein CrcB
MDASFAVMSLAIAAGGALGSVLRYWCSFFIARTLGETFPLGTLFVDVVGSFLIVLFAEVTGHDGRLLVSSLARQFVMVGIFGGYTTFSSLVCKPSIWRWTTKGRRRSSMLRCRFSSASSAPGSATSPARP